MKNPDDRSRKVVSLSIHPEIHDASAQKAKELGYTFSGYVAELIRRDLEKSKRDNEPKLNKN